MNRKLILGLLIIIGLCFPLIKVAGACPAECPCLSGDCEGGLVPCGRSCDDPTTDVCECCPCTLCHLFVLFKRVVDFVFLNIVLPLGVLMIVIGGVMLLTAAGDPGRINQGKSVIKAVIIGLVIIFIAWLIVNTVITFLTPADSPLQSWNTIDCPVP
jgi:predicted secreted protein